MEVPSRALLPLAIALLAGCGGGSSASPPPPPPIVAVTLAPSSVTAGQSSTITWSATGANSCTASGAWTGPLATSGTQTLTQKSAGSYSYTVTCAGAGGSTGKSATLTVTATAPTAAITLAPPSVAAGQSSVLTWSATDANACTASGAWTGALATSGTRNISQASPGYYTYTVTCDGAGGSTERSATLTVTGTPPTIAIALAPISVIAGQSSVLTWSAANASACTASGAWTGALATSGTRNISQASPGSYSYTITCEGAGGSAAKSAILTVTALQPVVSIALSPSTISSDHFASLTWSTSNATSCIASGSWAGPQVFTGSQTVGPLASGTYTYTLTCSNQSLSASNSAVLKVVSPQVLTTTLTANPTSVSVGSSTTLTWSSAGAQSCTASGDWSGTLPPMGSKAVPVPVAGGNTYGLQCLSATGDGNAQVTVQGLASTVTLAASAVTTGVGQPITLTWSSTQATSCTASGAWSGTFSSSGTHVVTPSVVGNNSYVLTCGYPGAPGHASVIVIGSVPVPSLSVFPTSVVAGKTVTLTWNGEYANACVASGAWSGSLSASGSQTLTMTAPGTEKFDLSCSNAAASVPAAEATVTVNTTPASPPATAYRINEAHDGVLITSNGIGYPASSAPTWTVDLGEPVSYPLIANGMVFVVTADANEAYGNQLYALNAATGAKVWGPVAISGVYFGSGLTYENGRVFVLMFDGGLHAFDTSTGAALWTTQLGGYWYESSPNAYGGVIFIVGNVGLQAVDESSGKILWTTTSAGSTDWDSPGISSAGVYAQSGDCLAGAYNPTTGSSLWQTSTQCNGTYGYTSIVKDGIVFGRTGAALNLFDAATGRQMGQLASSRAPAITGTAVIALNSGTLSSTNLSDFTQAWTFTGDGDLVTAPLVVNDTVLIGSSSGNVYGLNATTGKQVWVGMSPTPINSDSENGGPMPPSGPAAGENVLIFLAGTSVVAWTFQ